MRTIDIFVSSFPDVQKEHVVAGQLIRSAAAEFNLPINVHYSNPLRASRAQGGSIGSKDFANESALVLSACFWEYPEPEENDFLEIPNTGLYDLVICILGSRLGASPLQQCVMPDGSRPRSATDYEVGWALYQSKQTPGCPDLHVYRSRAIPAAPLEPREQGENLFRQRDAVQEFCGAWEKDDGTGFRECCHDFQGLEEFEDLFRERQIRVRFFAISRLERRRFPDRVRHQHHGAQAHGVEAGRPGLDSDHRAARRHEASSLSFQAAVSRPPHERIGSAGREGRRRHR